MNFPDLPEPDSIAESMLGSIFGSASIVVLLFLVIKWALAWLEATRSAIELGRSARSSITATIRRLSTVPASYRWMGFAISLAMILLQIIWAGLAYVTGNLVSMALGVEPGRDDGLFEMTLAHFLGLLHLDWVSGAYMACCGAGLLYAYSAAKFYGKHTGLAIALSSPVLPIALFGTLGTALIALDYFQIVDVYSNTFTGGQVLLAALMGIASIGYIGATIAALNTPGLVFYYWRCPPV